MGSSFTKKSGPLVSNINQLQTETKRIHDHIINTGSIILKELQEGGYLNQDSFCKKLGYFKADELKELLPIQILNGVRYKIGVKAPISNELEGKKEQICKEIVEFHLLKANTIKKIVDKTPFCKNLEGELWTSTANKIYMNGISAQDKKKLYDTLVKFNKRIKYRYTQISNNLDRIRTAKNYQELQRITNTTLQLLESTNRECTYYNNLIINYKANAKGIVISTAATTQPMKPTQLPSETINVINLESARAGYDYNKQNQYDINLKAGEKVDILSRGDDWTFIRTSSGLEGYVPSSYLQTL